MRLAYNRNVRVCMRPRLLEPHTKPISDCKSTTIFRLQC